MDATAYTVVAPLDDGGELQPSELRQILQRADDETKLETLRRIIIATLNGSSQPSLLMPIIQYVLPSKNKQLKKMLHFYWEVCPKYDDQGKLKQEMILVVNAIRNDLQHPNEYIRGSTLRFLQKIKEPELLEALIPSVRSCLEHRHSYVRKNAVFCVAQIYQRHEAMLSDAPELMETFLAAEQDATCKRNAFVLLCNASPDKAIEYLLSQYEAIPAMDELMQLAVIELIRKKCKADSPHRTKYIRAISELLSASSHAVKYEAAITLTSLTQNAAAIKATASALIDLVAKESDNNVKLIVLSRLDALRSRHEHVIDPLVMDLLRVLSSPDMDVKKKALAIALEMVSSRNIEEVVLLLKKELMKTVDGSSGFDKNIEYRQLLIQSIHTCAIKFSEVAANVVHVLMEFLGDSSNPSAVDVISFVREVVEKFPDLRSSILEKLLRTFGDIKSGKVFRGALWIVGEYCESIEDVQEAMQQIRKVVGEVPILAAEERLLEQAESADGEEETRKQKDEAAPKVVSRVRADGTYATETAFSSEANASARLEAVKNASKPPLRSLILLGDFYTATVLASTLTKIVLRFSELSSEAGAKNAMRAEAMLIMTSVVRVGQSKFAQAPIDEDSVERIMTCVQTLATAATEEDVAGKDVDAVDVFLNDTKQAYAKMVAAEERKAAEKAQQASRLIKVQPDDLISFRQLSKKTAAGAPGAEMGVEDYEAELTKATGSSSQTKDDFISKLQRVVQLTGFSDAVYAEAYVNVHQFDILLDVLVVNQSSETLQNLTIEFATLGDLKLVERPSSHTLAPYSFQSIKATIKVSSTETGVIFGNITYEGAAGTGTALSGEAKCVVLNDIHIDIMDYINPATCTESQFRSMWTEFEWENKVSVNTNISGLRAYLAHIMKSTNMACLTPEASLAGECGFLSANLYARSLFGEDALANLSIEELEDGTIQGHVRIRSKTQGIALSLGDKITLAQKVSKE
ncbi:putative SEC26-coatomer complex beta chain of secretory pathway vesicles [Acaromyces ingoldii]|uniref:Coatomer subunit beta n=1 Tax=Acaromyces ingoldii TaxID=215250 RepID=A0A316YUF5_9BASI|nr:putative SEC26-coatomer complex beta chain of secretory pathway vesicles [Acaromyces ingoldii]PWN92308.1 putative SEC26-coatomer complex beta chain of secretory pathway vesicles [Acaromyces ingoldii]